MYIFWGLEVSIPGFFGVGKFIYLFIYLLLFASSWHGHCNSTTQAHYSPYPHER